MISRLRRPEPVNPENNIIARCEFGPTGPLCPIPHRMVVRHDMRPAARGMVMSVHQSLGGAATAAAVQCAVTAADLRAMAAAMLAAADAADQFYGMEEPAECVPAVVMGMEPEGYVPEPGRRAVASVLPGAVPDMDLMTMMQLEAVRL